MNKIEFKDFKIIKSFDSEKLEKQVNEHLKNGYILIGGTFSSFLYDKIQYTQSIAKKVNLEIYKTDLYEVWYDKDELVEYGFDNFRDYAYEAENQGIDLDNDVVLKIIKISDEIEDPLEENK